MQKVVIGIVTLSLLGYLIRIDSTRASSRDRLRLIRADRLEQYRQQDVIVKKLTGDVHFRKGAVDLTCDLAFWFEKEDKAEFYYNVVMTKREQRLTADTLVYFADRELILARGEVTYNDSTTTLTSRQLKYYVEDDIAEAYGSVVLRGERRDVTARQITYFSESKKAIALWNATLTDSERNTLLHADSLVYYSGSGDLEATQSPVVIKQDSTGEESFRIKGDIIKGYEDRGLFISIGNVEIWREDFHAYSREMEYYDSLEVAEMTGKPRVLRDGEVLTGERMKLFLRNEVLYSLYIYENAVASSRSFAFLPFDTSDTSGTASRDSVRTFDEITGRMMEIYFVEGKTDSIRVSGMATSYYNVTEDSVIQGVNIASGDTVIMNFRDKRLRLITVIGGTEGKFLPHETNTGVDTTVIYGAETIHYYLDQRVTDLLKKSLIEYGDMELKAGKIAIHWNQNLLYAYPLSELLADSASGDTPTLYQKGREPFSGGEMVYNLKTQKGRIVEGRTKEEDGFYYGDNIAKVDKKVFYVKNGVYTTCDIPDTPHYHFQSKRMKLIHQDKIIAKPIVLYIHQIPLLALPFGVFPNRGGRRHSGWIMPTYGESNTAGGNIRGLGYFWAPSDYYDFRLTTDFYDRRGILLHYRTRYKLRYKFSGNISGSYTNEFFSDYPERRWNINIRHSQRLSPTMQFNANGRFVSQNNDEYFRRYGVRESTRLDQLLVSNATLSKTWPGKPYSLSVTLNQTNYLHAQQMIATPPMTSGKRINYINRSLPNISFSRGSKPLVPIGKGKTSAQSRWYNNIHFGVRSHYRNKEDIYYLSTDSLVWEKQGVQQNAMTHDISLNGSQKIFKYISLNQNVSINEDWINEYKVPEYDTTGGFVIEDGKIVTHTRREFRARHTGSASLSARTKLYGMFPLRIGPLQAVRHVMTPQVGLSYRPDFTREIMSWDPGYVETWSDTSGREWRHDYFRSTLPGATPSGEQKALTLGVSNIFQAKQKTGDEVKKLDLMTVNFNTRYNFAADSLRWSPISTSIRTQLTKKLVLNISTRHDLYAYRNGTVDEWHKEWYGVPLPRLTYVSANTGFSLSGKRYGELSKITGDETVEDTVATDLLNPLEVGEDPFDESRPREEGGELWSANFSLRYSLTRQNPAVKNETFWVSTNVRLNLSSKWKIGWRANFDLLEKKMVSQDFQISHDLHCWQLSFSWRPTGYGKQYSLVINVKSPTLRDLKYEERGGRMRGPGLF